MHSQQKAHSQILEGYLHTVYTCLFCFYCAKIVSYGVNVAEKRGTFPLQERSFPRCYGQLTRSIFIVEVYVIWHRLTRRDKCLCLEGAGEGRNTE